MELVFIATGFVCFHVEGDLDINIQSCPHICGLRQPEKNLKIKEINGSYVPKCAPSENGP
jgi:hypothetical protein